MCGRRNSCKVWEVNFSPSYLSFTSPDLPLVKGRCILAYSASLLSSIILDWWMRFTPLSTFSFFLELKHTSRCSFSLSFRWMIIKWDCIVNWNFVNWIIHKNEFQYTEHQLTIVLSHQLGFTNIFLTGNCCCNIICYVGTSNW